MMREIFACVGPRAGSARRLATAIVSASASFPSPKTPSPVTPRLPGLLPAARAANDWPSRSTQFSQPSTTAVCAPRGQWNGTPAETESAPAQR
jgi:hypothetical protein